MMSLAALGLLVVAVAIGWRNRVTLRGSTAYRRDFLTLYAPHASMGDAYAVMLTGRGA